MDFGNIIIYSFLISSVILSFCIEIVITKLANKKPINLKEKFYNKNNVFVHMQSTESALNTLLKEDVDVNNTTYQNDISLTCGDVDSVESISTEDTASEVLLKTNISTPPNNNTSCICGIFLGSQFVKGSPEPPQGDPVISTTLVRASGCNIIGQKQCQTKCLQQIIQHLPNSAKIVCASLDRDITKERAYLFVRNCNNKWHNTNLAGGKEYCCKNGLPYSCPKK